MLDVVKRKFGAPAERPTLFQRGRLDELASLARAQRASNGFSPVAILGTTLAFLELFDQCARDKTTFPMRARHPL